eukprot:scaffold471_cov318-Ochromonas_danica.AAC.37
MSEDDNWYLEALQNYLNSSEWKDTIHVFVQSNCFFFSDVDDLHPQQHVVWKSFQDIAESILDNALLNIGGSLHQLERSLDGILARPSRGPREELMKDVLHQLLSFDDFRVFARMMNAACQEELADKVYNINDNSYNVLMRMGFTAQGILSAIDSLGPEASLEDLVSHLGDSSMDAIEPPRASSKSVTRSSGSAAADAKSSLAIDCFEDGDFGGDFSHSPDVYPLPAALEKFISEAGVEGVVLEYGELKSKFHLADSLVDVYKQTHDQTLDTQAIPLASLAHDDKDSANLPAAVVAAHNKRDHGSSGGSNSLENEGMLDLVQWAAEMQVLLKDIHTAYRCEVPMDQHRVHGRGKGLIQSFLDLENTFQQANHNNSTLSAKEIERLQELDRIAANNTKDEQYLYSCINNYEQVQKEINKLYKKCSIITMTSPEIDSADLEEIYIFLKDEMGQDQSDIEQIYDRIYRHPIFLKLKKNKVGMECIQLLLDLHLLEQEIVFLKQEIQLLVGGSPNRVRTSEEFDAKDVEDSIIRFDHLDDFIGLDQVVVNEAAAGALGGGNGGGLGFGMQSPQVVHNAMAGEENDYKASPSETAAPNTSSALITSPVAGITTASTTAPPLTTGYDYLLDGLKEGHRNALIALKENLLMAKSHALQSLEERLLRKKLLRKNLAEEKSTSPEDLQEVDDDIHGLEEEIQQRSDALTSLNNHILESYRDRCIYELKEARALVAKAVEDGTIKKIKDLQDLLGQDPRLQENIHNSIIAAIKNRYFDERNRLLASLELQRSQQRARLQAILQSKLKQVNVDKKEEEEEKAMAWYDEEEDKAMTTAQTQYSKALQAATEDYIYQMAAMKIDVKDLALPAAQADDDDDGDYLAEVTRSKPRHGMMDSYIKQVEAMKVAYLQANANLQEVLLAKQQSRSLADRKAGRRKRGGPVDDHEAEANAVEQEVLQLLSQSVVNAFEDHLQEAFDHQQPSSSMTKGRGMMDGDDRGDLYQRARIGILNAFEKAKTDLNDVQSVHRKNTQARLAARLQRQGLSSSSKALAEESLDAVEALLEGVMDGFLDDSSNTTEEVAIAKRRLGMSLDAEDKYEASLHDKERRDRLKQLHSDRHKALEDNLYADMMDKKRKLEDRIRKKREQESKLANATNASDGIPSTPRDEPWTESVVEVPGNVSLQTDSLDAVLSDSTVQPERIERQPLPPLAFPKASEAEYAQEAKRIAYTYTEEKEKHDLLMKIQENRQRQQLQKKLWQRHQNKQNQISTNNTLRDGGLDDNDGPDSARGPPMDSISIGQFQSRIPNQRPNAQPAIKGLSPNKVPIIADQKRTASMMAMRGLNLAPMMRK